jgi:hypothetical protein
MSPASQRCLLLLRTDGAGEEALSGVIRLAIDAARDLPRGDTVTDAWIEIADDPLGRTFRADPYAAAIRVDTTGGPDELIDAVTALAPALRPPVDPARSAVVAGTVHTLDPGDGDLGLLFCMKAKGGMSLAEFHDYWLNEHAEQHAHRSGLGYRQLHADPDLSAKIAAVVGFGETRYAGVAEAVLASTDGMGGRHGRGDRVNFVDENSEVGMVLRRFNWADGGSDGI